MNRIWIKRQACGLFSVLILLAGDGAGNTWAVEALAAHPPMLSHRAIYNVSLADRQNSGQVSSVQGRMVTQWQETCDGLISEQRIVTDMLDETGEKSLSDISASSWESLDGLRFRFSMRQRLDNRLVAEYDGNAEYASALGQGKAIMRKPVEKEVILPAGVLFPSGYLQALLDAARGGRKIFARQVFDGTSESDYYEVVSSIGAGTTISAAGQAEKEQKGQNPAEHNSVSGAVSGLTWWPVQVSYYGLEQNEGLPEFEMAFRLYDNGVSSDLILDYGAFALYASLSRIETYKRPDC
ncbi:MAG: hypothetical protein Dbin4_00162 [Alphaproteobacteria bacterium]|nr:hypothetical protein [Alphaproteobacteria bacterium]